jgi:hypothetical protein
MRDHGSNWQGDSDRRYGMTYRSIPKLPAMTVELEPIMWTDPPPDFEPEPEQRFASHLRF